MQLKESINVRVSCRAHRVGSCGSDTERHDESGLTFSSSISTETTFRGTFVDSPGSAGVAGFGISLGETHGGCQGVVKQRLVGFAAGREGGGGVQRSGGFATGGTGAYGRGTGATIGRSHKGCTIGDRGNASNGFPCEWYTHGAEEITEFVGIHEAVGYFGANLLRTHSSGRYIGKRHGIPIHTHRNLAIVGGGRGCDTDQIDHGSIGTGQQLRTTCGKGIGEETHVTRVDGNPKVQWASDGRLQNACVGALDTHGGGIPKNR